MEAIAIVGVACRYPEAATPTELWENVLAQRRAFRRIPPERLRFEDYFSPDRDSPDRVYAFQAALIEGFDFDRVRFRISGTAFRSVDTTHWLALDVAAKALADAGFEEGNSLPRETTGVLVGNTLTGEISRANQLRLRWPYVARMVYSALVKEGWDEQHRKDFINTLEETFKAPFAPITEETLAGGLSNTISGRICNYFDLQGSGYTVDGACSASLLAVSHACSALSSGDMDVALAGGVDISLDPFELVGFAKVGALAEHEMWVFDARSSGFIPGEGCGFVVLMREQDAVAQKRRIYALIRGWGLSSDGSGGITRPEIAGQMLSLKRAYRRAGLGIQDVQYFEGHGTGTAVGDATELRALSAARRNASSVEPAAIGSVKANIGHTKAAAGVAGLIKTVMALDSQVLPPTTGSSKTHPELACEEPALRTLSSAEPWPENRKLLAGVSAMGFGGINVHVVVEGAQAERPRLLSPRAQSIAGSAQDCELFLFRESDTETLRSRIRSVRELGSSLSIAQLSDLSVRLFESIGSGDSCAAITAATPDELLAALEEVEKHLYAHDPISFNANVHVSTTQKQGPPKVAFIFPGQGSPFSLKRGFFCGRFPLVRELYDQGAIPSAGDQLSTAIAQPAIVGWSVGALRMLRSIGIEAEVALGHSLGELCALHWAGAFDEQSLFRIARYRGHLMSTLGRPDGMMANLEASREVAEEILETADVVIAAINGPSATVISGNRSGMTHALELAHARGIRSVPLQVSCAFHSPLMQLVVPGLRGELNKEKVQDLSRDVASTVTGKLLDSSCDLRELLCDQLTQPVRFSDAVHAASQKGVDTWIEVGPGQVLGRMLTGLGVENVFSIDAGGQSLRPLLQTVGALFVRNAPLSLRSLFDERFVRSIDLHSRPKFIANPCEQAPPGPITTTDAPRSNPSVTLGGVTDSSEQTVEVVRKLVAERAELPLHSVHNDHRLLSDLHLNSIAVGQIVAQAAKALGTSPPLAATDYADSSVGEIATILEKSKMKERPSDSSDPPAGLDFWLRPFRINLVESPLVPANGSQVGAGFKVFASPNHPFSEKLATTLAQSRVGGAFVCLPHEPDESTARFLIEATNALLSGSVVPRLVVVQSTAVGAAFAKSLHLELPHITTCTVRIPYAHPESCNWVLKEALAAQGYAEAQYDEIGRRFQPYLWAIPPEAEHERPPLNHDDVLLVSGGGKGIAAECAMKLAEALGVRLLLIGRSSPSQDPVLEANLSRFRAAGFRFHYEAADVLNSASLREAVRRGTLELGKVTGLLHAAGVNAPQSIRSLTLEACRRTLAPKIDGLRKLLAILDSDRLRSVITFGSLIARSGFPGEADYALANEWMTHLTEQWQMAHPRCHCLAIEWSAWSGVGMGATLSNLAIFKNHGISMIAPESGSKSLIRLLAGKMPNVGVVMTSRIGSTPTLQLQPQPLPHLRFLEKSRVYYPQVELVADAYLSAETDLYLEDHELHDQRLLPAVIGLEQMAQAAMAMSGEKDPPVFERVEFSRPIVVSEEKTVSRVVALAARPEHCEVALRTGDTEFSMNHFRADCSFARRETRTSSAKHDEVVTLPLNPDEDLYGNILFQGPRFQCLSRYTELSADRCVAEIMPRNLDHWFARYLPATFTLGHPGVRDAAIHSLQACIPHQRVLPVGIDRLVIHNVDGPFPYTVRAQERVRDKDRFVFDLELTSTDQTVCETWEGLHLRALEPLPTPTRWPEPLLGPYLERCVHSWVPGCGVRVLFMTGSAVKTEDVIRQLTRSNASLMRRNDGKLEMPGAAISVAHCEAATLAMAGPDSVGCDVEIIEGRPSSIWRELLGRDCSSLANSVAVEAQEDENVAATRVWTVLESLKKAGAPRDIPVVVSLADQNGWFHFSAGRWRIATLVTQIKASLHHHVFSLAFVGPDKRTTQWESSRNCVRAASCI